MLVPLTDPNHQLAILMIDQIRADQERQLRASARRETGDLYDEAVAPAPRRSAWSRLAIVQRDASGKRTVRIFRAPAPAI
jgi:hypothetical protein